MLGHVSSYILPINFVLVLLCRLTFCVVGSDPDPLHDYCVADTKNSHIFHNGVPCINPNHTTSDHFGTSALSLPGDDLEKQRYATTFTDVNNLPGMNTLGLALARTDFAADGLVPPHSHPKASELLILLEGSLLVGFVDTSNQIYRQQLSPGDCFVFPKALVHFLYNVNSDKPALALSGFNSQNPGGEKPSRSTLFMPDFDPTVVGASFGWEGHDQWPGFH